MNYFKCSNNFAVDFTSKSFVSMIAFKILHSKNMEFLFASLKYSVYFLNWCSKIWFRVNHVELKSYHLKFLCYEKIYLCIYINFKSLNGRLKKIYLFMNRNKRRILIALTLNVEFRANLFYEFIFSIMSFINN